ncbi:MAG: hypothetical protein HKN70_13405 [Gammaproteobacteria bacterium]|nr:hypothetical protein [Gammaproteobacteria bacterium]
MGLFKRISATITSSVDQAITRVENHDAIVAAAIKSTQTSAAKARVRLARVQKDGETLRARAHSLNRAEAAWASRAKTVAANDKPRALECVRRRKQVQAQLEHINASLKQHDELEGQVADTLQKIQARLAEMNQQRNMMRSRESVADAMRIINNLNGANASDIEETFDRWEVLITESELSSGNYDQVDTLEAGFIEVEDQAELEAELDALLNEEGRDHDSA